MLIQSIAERIEKERQIFNDDDDDDVDDDDDDEDDDDEDDDDPLKRQILALAVA